MPKDKSINNQEKTNIDKILEKITSKKDTDYNYNYDSGFYYESETHPETDYYTYTTNTTHDDSNKRTIHFQKINPKLLIICGWILLFWIIQWIILGESTPDYRISEETIKTIAFISQAILFIFLTFRFLKKDKINSYGYIKSFIKGTLDGFILISGYYLLQTPYLISQLTKMDKYIIYSDTLLLFFLVSILLGFAYVVGNFTIRIVQVITNRVEITTTFKTEKASIQEELIQIQEHKQNKYTQKYDINYQNNNKTTTIINKSNLYYPLLIILGSIMILFFLLEKMFNVGLFEELIQETIPFIIQIIIFTTFTIIYLKKRIKENIRYIKSFLLGTSIGVISLLSFVISFFIIDESGSKVIQLIDFIISKDFISAVSIFSIPIGIAYLLENIIFRRFNCEPEDKTDNNKSNSYKDNSYDIIKNNINNRKDTVQETIFDKIVITEKVKEMNTFLCKNCGMIYNKKIKRCKVCNSTNIA
jgi:hypothetical protein